MQAVSKSIPFVVPHQIPIPTSFQQALSLGWKIVKEESSIDDGARERKGVVLLRKNGVPFRLRVSYVGTRKGFSFSKPAQIE